MHACMRPYPKIHCKGVLDMPVRVGRLLRQRITFVGAHVSWDTLARSAEELVSIAAGRKPDSTWNNALRQFFREYLNSGLIQNVLQKTKA